MIFSPVPVCLSCLERRLHENYETGNSSLTTISNLQQIFSFLLSLVWFEIWTCSFLLQLYGSLSLLTCFLILPIVSVLRVVCRAYLIDYVRLHSEAGKSRKFKRTASSSSSSSESHLLLLSDRYERLQDKEEEEEREGEAGKQVNDNQKKEKREEEEDEDEERRLAREGIQDELKRFHASLKMTDGGEHERLVKNRREKEEEGRKKRREDGEVSEEEEEKEGDCFPSSFSLKEVTEAFLKILESSTTFWGPSERKKKNDKKKKRKRKIEGRRGKISHRHTDSYIAVLLLDLQSRGEDTP